MDNLDEYSKALEKQVWDAAIKGDAEAFSLAVADDAVMICGGYRCSGKEYAGYISEKPMKSYKILSFEVLQSADGFIQVHYVVNVEAANDEFAGEFHVTSTWRKIQGQYKLVFNMDSRIIN